MRRTLPVATKPTKGDVICITFPLALELELELNKTEQEKLDNSCKIIKEMREESIDKIIEE